LEHDDATTQDKRQDSNAHGIVVSTSSTYTLFESPRPNSPSQESRIPRALHPRVCWSLPAPLRLFRRNVRLPFSPKPTGASQLLQLCGVDDASVPEVLEQLSVTLLAKGLAIAQDVVVGFEVRPSLPPRLFAVRSRDPP